jgi:hypothetical protein
MLLLLANETPPRRQIDAVRSGGSAAGAQGLSTIALEMFPTALIASKRRRALTMLRGGGALVVIHGVAHCQCLNRRFERSVFEVALMRSSVPKDN